MREAKKVEGRSCPKCGSLTDQVNHGYNRSGTQRCKCNNCGKVYTHNPKNRAYSSEIRQAAMRTYYSGVSGRGVGKVFGMSKANVLNWIKKTRQSVDKS
jgi:transposase-like protein